MKAVPTQVGYSRLGHSILPISGKPEIGCCPHPSRRAHAPRDEGRLSSRLAAEPFSVIPSSRCQTAHLVPAARFCARGLQPCFTNPESRGGRSAERRSGARRNTRGVRHNAAYQALARRLASHDAGRSPLGAPPWRFFTRGRASVSGMTRSRTASSSQPGPSAWRATSRASRGKRLQAAAAGRHASLRLRDRLRRRPSMSETGHL